MANELFADGEALADHRKTTRWEILSKRLTELLASRKPTLCEVDK
jgi:hypothetical protein